MSKQLRSGSVFQRVINITKPLVKDLLSLLVHIKPNVLVFVWQKMSVLYIKYV